MSAGGSEQQGLFGRSISMKWFLAMVGGLIVLLAVVVVVVVLVGRDGGNSKDAETADQDAVTLVTSPYDLVEMPADVDLDAVSKAAFVSVYVPNNDGQLTSYGVSSDLPAAKALTEAVKKADELDQAEADAATGMVAAKSTITFVLPSRETITFSLYVQQGIIAREGHAWRPDGDLASLVDAAIKSPQ
jgi:hypothetical protein